MATRKGAYHQRSRGQWLPIEAQKHLLFDLTEDISLDTYSRKSLRHQGGLAVDAEVDTLNLIAALVVLAAQQGVAVLVERGLAVDAEAGDFDLIAALVVFAAPQGVAVLVKRGLAVDAEVGTLDLIAALVVFAVPQG